MDNIYTILRVWKHTAHQLKILAAIQHESMIAVLERLITAECQRVGVPLRPQDTSKP
jgi:hypothetical protein